MIKLYQIQFVSNIKQWDRAYIEAPTIEDAIKKLLKSFKPSAISSCKEIKHVQRTKATSTKIDKISGFTKISIGIRIA